MAEKKQYKTYSEKLQDVRWQKMRLAVMERDNFTCKRCKKDKDITLNVHHTKYFKGRDPWNYDMIYLETLCSVCHYGEHNELLIAPEKEWEGLLHKQTTSTEKTISRLQELLKKDLHDDLQEAILTKLIYLRKKSVVIYG